MAESKLAKAINLELTEIIAKLVELGLADFQNFPSVVRLADSGWRVSTDKGLLATALKKRPYADLYSDVLESGSFGVLLLDGAILHFSYEGKSDTLSRHRLAYLPSPSLAPYQDDPELYLRDIHFVEIVGYQVVPTPVRFDFDAREGAARDLVHPVSHLTLGQYQHCRIPVMRALAPSDFASFIFRNFYSTPDLSPIEFQPRASGLSNTITDAEREQVHVALPDLTDVPGKSGGIRGSVVRGK